MSACPTCNKRVLSHAYQIKCYFCVKTYNLKCISLDPEYHDYIRQHIDEWMCLICNTVVFPFNAIEVDVDFTEECGVTSRNELKTSDLI